ncbi:hypothetical protein NDU88_000435, partial [Pleurodeles waltl]
GVTFSKRSSVLKSIWGRLAKLEKELMELEWRPSETGGEGPTWHYQNQSRRISGDRTMGQMYK